MPYTLDNDVRWCSQRDSRHGQRKSNTGVDWKQLVELKKNSARRNVSRNRLQCPLVSNDSYRQPEWESHCRPIFGRRT
jgi:hypothetical protein